MRFWLLASALAFSFDSVAIAHEKATDLVNERIEKMERFEELIDRIFALMHGKLAFSA